MSKIEIGQDSPILKLIYLKIRRRDGVESSTILERGVQGAHWRLHKPKGCQAHYKISLVIGIRSGGS